MNVKTLYEHDFYSWIQHHVALLKDSRFDEMDVNNLIEELEGMAKKDERELVSRLIILIAHLLKWQYQPNMQSNSWQSSIIEQRAQILFLLEDVPSLSNKISAALLRAYPKAREIAVKETGLVDLPKQCPYNEKQMLDDDFYPY
ncbi:MAG: DUF29 domain-containing protein [Methylococcaceae bacterium]|nr:DUF29 domain-containing protein [Methylococcaceae bacterium]